MDETKYGKYIRKDCIGLARHTEIKSKVFTLRGDRLDGVNWSINWDYLTEPFLMVRETFVHDFDDFLIFMGGDPTDIADFHAEVELCLGPEREMHVIDSTCLVYIPAGLMHCPINFRKIDKPIVFMHSFLYPTYIRQVITNE